MLAQANSLISTLNQEAGEQVHFKHLYFMDLRHFAKSKFFLSHFYWLYSNKSAKLDSPMEIYKHQ